MTAHSFQNNHIPCINIRFKWKGMKQMDTKKFRTRQEIRRINNPKSKRDFIIGIDVGYSGTKVFHENGYLVFPSYAKKIENGMLNVPDEMDIMYRDEETGDVYMVGRNAQEMMETTDTNDTDGELFSRKRYSDKRFRIVCNTAVAMALGEAGDKRAKDCCKVVIQTGLPSSYVTGDTPAVKKAFANNMRFSLKTGNGPWKTYEPSIREEDVYVMPQPAGALYSVLIKNDGVYTNDAMAMLSSNVLVMDAGFGTFDFYGIKNRSIVCRESVDQMGMREVLKQTSKKILSDLNEDIRVAALQKNLESGTVVCIDEEKMESGEKPIAPYLESASGDVFKEAMAKAKSVTDTFRGYNYVIVDGGTGEAWYEDIRQWLSKMKTLKVMPSNFNDHLPMIYSNSRGYYMFRYVVNNE